MIARAAARHGAIADATTILALDRRGRPVCRNHPLILQTIAALLETHNGTAIDEILVHGFLRQSRERYEEHVAPQLEMVHEVEFEMGTAHSAARHFCGETPRHSVHLSPFLISCYLVTNELYALFDQSRLDFATRDRRRPVVGVTWIDASLFALWMGCRLPTEAEWEFACGLGSSSEWCCAAEEDLFQHAWFSENAGGTVQWIGTREPNALGLCDFHGNVWEWCADAYDASYYARAPTRDPVNNDSGGGTHRVCRGGSVHALAEMCRTRYRLHEPCHFWAGDLGFRLAADAATANGR
jgi:formylglycine-generating enzyme